MRFFIIVLFFSLCNIGLFGFNNDKSIEAQKVDDAINIDGKLSESIWQTEPQISNFYQYIPNNGAAPSSKTEAWFYYSDKGIYVGIKCYEENIDSIYKELMVRDEGFGSNSDGIGVMLSPYNDGLNYNYFLVSAANVQTDEVYSGEDSDNAWNAVWYSEVSQTQEGWECELFIPYSALRFPKKDVQTWGINVWRHIARTQEWCSWSYVNSEDSFWWKYTGEVNNLKNLDPPLRLSVTPYVSGYLEKETGKKRIPNYNIGMDLKYGISQSITLDMTLIPDFRQVQSDDVELNLSPFEQYYNEKRQFFTEGMDLFNKADIFYSRRIGQEAQKYNIVYDSLKANEVVTNNPTETQLINSTKISGRTKTGLGFGLLNSMTKKSYAEIEDSINGETRIFQTQPFTNYNVLVLDQTLSTNSYLSFINTNYYNSEYMSNVIATDFNIGNSKNIYGLRGVGAYSYVDDERVKEGYKASLNGGKIGGKFHAIYNLSVISKDYNQNYMGFMRNNNQFNNSIALKYKITKPFSYFLNLTNSVDFNYNRLLTPNVYSEFSMSYVLETKFKNQYSFLMHAALAPIEKHDYYETRADGRYVELNKWYHNCFTLSSNPTKTLSASIHYGFTNSYDYFLNTKTYSLSFEPSIRINNKLTISYDSYYSNEKNKPGYVNSDDNDIYFGKRNRETVTNTFGFSYIFTNTMSFKLRIRHYWSKAEYDEFYALSQKGLLIPSNYSENHNINYNAFNLDMTYSWNFAPGSELLLNWKSSTNSSGDELIGNYWDNVSSFSDYSNVNSFSIKFLYYLDYHAIKSKMN